MASSQQQQTGTNISLSFWLSAVFFLQVGRGTSASALCLPVCPSSSCFPAQRWPFTTCCCRHSCCGSSSFSALCCSASMASSSWSALSPSLLSPGKQWFLQHATIGCLSWLGCNFFFPFSVRSMLRFLCRSRVYWCRLEHNKRCQQLSSDRKHCNFLQEEIKCKYVWDIFSFTLNSSCDLSSCLWCIWWKSPQRCSGGWATNRSTCWCCGWWRGSLYLCSVNTNISVFYFDFFLNTCI